MICNQMTIISSSESFKVHVLYFEMGRQKVTPGSEGKDANKNND